MDADGEKRMHVDESGCRRTKLDACGYSCMKVDQVDAAGRRWMQVDIG